MNKIRKICVITGTRAEYGHLSNLIRLVDEDPSTELQLLVCGMHLEEKFGNTYQEIEADGFTITRKIPMQLNSDSPEGICYSMSLGLNGFATAFKELEPDMIVILGDRFEMLAAASAATVSRIPIAHISGGATTEGAIDESIRHSLTKMSHLHFTSAADYRRRVIQLGEAPERVFDFGELCLDNIEKMEFLNWEDFEASIGVKLKPRNLLVTFHPVTLEHNSSGQQFGALLKALDELEDTLLIFTKPNADTDGGIIIQMIDEYVAANSERSVAFTSLGKLRYLSALRYVDGVVGNSSSGLAEAPSFKIGTVNIGDRQKGRIKAASVIDCEPETEAISLALEKLYSSEFKEVLKNVSNPFGKSGACEKILEVLKSYPLDNILKKSFYDLDFPVPPETPVS
jgi:GDP/UDP-N,N'-diacetylbacillosamine 2-epimerase (hydrolysing)